MTDFLCNVLIMGKTGTGKSSLLNYICGQDLAKVAAGKPVTGEGLFPYEVTINDQQIRIFDSWGIEAGKVDRWMTLLEKSLQEHGVHKSMEEWFHSVIYCIQAGGARIEEIDSKIIRQFLNEGYNVTIILTKADQADPEQEKLLKEAIFNEVKSAKAGREDSIKIVSCCSQELNLRSGHVDPFGKEELQKAILDGWKETIIDRMPKHVIGRICQEIDLWAEGEKETVNNQAKITGIGAWNKDIYKAIVESAKKKVNQIQDKILPETLKESIESCHKANASLSNIFNIQLNNQSLSQELLEETSSKVKEIITGLLSGIFLIPIIAQLIAGSSKKLKEEQKQKIGEFVDNLSSELKEQIQLLEEDVTSIIEESLSS